MSLSNSDFIPEGLVGNIAVRSKTASFAKTIVSDATTEGVEKFIATLRKDGPDGNILAQSNIVIINDTSQVSPLPSYSLSVTPSLADEGNTLTFNLTTLNVSGGTLIPYTITGISAEDLSNGQLTGVFVVGPTGTATASVTLAEDLTTEGFETLVMTLDNIDPIVAVSVLINDVSTTPGNLPAYSLTASEVSVNETDGTNSFVINLLTNNVPAGNLVPYTITGVTSADMGNISLTGNFQVTAAGTDFKVFNAAADQLTEGIETFVITLDNVVPLVRTSVIINDTSQSSTPATYSLSANISQVSEGSMVRFTLGTTNIPNLAQIPYTITGTGITSGDITASLTGRFIINSSGIGIVDLAIAADEISEGTEVLTLSLDGVTPPVSASTTINDTSTAPKPGSYALFANKSAIDEGESVIFTLTTVNVNAGVQVPYTLQGIDSADIGNVPVTGFFIVNQSGVAQTSVTYTSTADEKTEGNEIMTMRITGSSAFASVLIRDTSKDPVPEYTLSHTRIGVPAYIITPTDQTINQWYRKYLGRDVEEDGLSYWSARIASGVSSLAQVEAGIANSSEAQAWDGVQRVSEGTSVDVKLITANVAIGTQVPYTISGVISGDISNAPLTGTIPVTGTFRAGTGTVRLNIAADRLTEGIETLKFALNGITPEVSTSFEIADTSIARGFNINAVTNTDEDQTITITLTAFGYRDGSVIPFTISGTNINADDMSSTRITWNPSTSRFEGNFTVTSNSDSFQLYINDDATPEGPETFTISITSVSPAVSHSVLINDTSQEKSGTAVLTDARQLKLLGTLPKAATWVAFKMIGAGGSGGGNDGQPNNGYGYYFATDGSYSGFLNTYGVWKEGAGSTWTDNFQVYFPSTGAYGFTLSTDNIGSVSVDGVAVISHSDFRNTAYAAVNVTAGMHTVGLSATNTGGPASIGVVIQISHYIIWETASLALNGGGAGGSGVYTEGIVRLPVTTDEKLLFGGIGEPGNGGAGTGRKDSEPGGIGYYSGSTVNMSAKTSVALRGDGGAGGQEGPGGTSGGGGAGGGSSGLFYGTSGTIVHISSAGGGGGGGGGSNRVLSRYNNANSGNRGETAASLSSPNGPPGVNAPGDGGGGGAGGGGGGAAGTFGRDNNQHGQGGSAGYATRNTTALPTWAAWASISTSKVSESWPTGRTMFAEGVNQPYPWIAFGRGGPGARPWPFGVGGQRGAIALYWTTRPTAPTLSQVPPWNFPTGTVSLHPGPAVSGIVLYPDGTGVCGDAAFNWYSTPSNGIGEFFETKFSVSGSGTANSNIGLDVWNPIWAFGNRSGNYCRPADGAVLSVNVQIRRRSDNVIVADKTYNDVAGTPVGGDGCCVVSTAFASTGIWSNKQKDDLIVWCEKYLHGSWWGEAFRKGYQVLGSLGVRKLVRAGGLRTKYADWAFTNGTNLVRGKKFSLLSLPNSLLWIVAFMCVGMVVSKDYADRVWKKLYQYDNEE
jgi:Domain of unknown function (DUF4214)